MNDPSFGYQSGGNSDVWLHRLVREKQRQGTIGPRPDHVVFSLSDGSAILTSDHGVATTIVPGEPTMLSASLAYAFTTDATSMSLLHIAAPFLQSVSGRETSAGSPVEFAVSPKTPALGSALMSLLDGLEAQLLSAELTSARRARLNRRIATAVLSTFAPSASDEESRLRRALRFAHDHATETIDVGDIAAAAGLSERGLQHLFRRTLNVTPMRYLREVRLDGAHLEFTSQDATTQSVLVHDVAQRWQFFHLGRFAAMYRARFGQSPRESLQDTARRPADNS